jgi:hypothetical protein
MGKIRRKEGKRMSNDMALTHFHNAQNWTWGDGDGYIWQVGKCLECGAYITRRQYDGPIYTEWVELP